MFTSTPPSFLSLWFFLFWEGMTNDLSSYGINRQKLCVVSKVMSNILPLLLLYFINYQSCSYFFYYTPVYLLIFCTDIFISRYIYIFEYTHFATFCTFNMLHISALNSLCFYIMFFRLILNEGVKRRVILFTSKTAALMEKWDIILNHRS